MYRYQPRSLIESRIFTHKEFTDRITQTIEIPEKIKTFKAAERWLTQNGYHLVPDTIYRYADDEDLEPLYLYYSYDINKEETFQKYICLLNIGTKEMSQDQRNEFRQYIKSIYIFAISETGRIFLM